MASEAPPQTEEQVRRAPLVLRLMRGAFFALVWGYLLVGIAYIVARFTTNEYNTLVTVGNLLLHLYLLPAIVLLPLSLLLRGKTPSALLGLFVLYFGVLYGPQFMPRRIEEPPADAVELRVMSYNSAGGRTRGVDLPALMVLYRPDIVGLLEVSRPNRDLIRDVLSVDYPYRIESYGGDDQKVLLSKYPILAEDTFTLDTARTNIEARLDVEGVEVSVYVVHPPSPDFQDGLNFYVTDPSNWAEVSALSERVDATVPTLLLGDFNFTAMSDAHWRLQAVGFSDAFREAGSGFGLTYNMRQRELGVNRPITRIDYVWHTSHFTATDALTASATRSDHIPVIADLWLERD